MVEITRVCDDKSWQVKPSSFGSNRNYVTSANKWLDDITLKQYNSLCSGGTRPKVNLHESSGIDGSAVVSRMLAVLLLIQPTGG